MSDKQDAVQEADFLETLFSALVPGFKEKAAAHHKDFEERKIGYVRTGWGFVSTVKVPDGYKPFATMVSDSRYDDPLNIGGSVVEAYDTAEEAAIGHDKWLAVMQGGKLPEELVDVLVDPEAKALAAKLTDGTLSVQLKPEYRVRVN